MYFYFTPSAYWTADLKIECSVPNLFDIGIVVLKWKVWITSMFFRYFFFSFQFEKKAWTIIWTNLYSLYPTMLCVMFCWNWPSISGEEYYNLKVNISATSLLTTTHTCTKSLTCEGPVALHIQKQLQSSLQQIPL